MEGENFEAVAASGRFQDLSAGEAADLFAPYEDLFVYVLPYDETYSKSEVPVGIDLSKGPLVTEYGIVNLVGRTTWEQGKRGRNEGNYIQILQQ